VLDSLRVQVRETPVVGFGISATLNVIDFAVVTGHFPGSSLKKTGFMGLFFSSLV